MNINIKIVFLAGAFRGDGTKRDKKANIKVAKQYARKLIKAGIPYYSPHLNVCELSLSIKENTDEQADHIHRVMFLKCSILAVLPGYEESGHTKEEIEEATGSMPVVYLSDDTIENLKQLYFG